MNIREIIMTVDIIVNRLDVVHWWQQCPTNEVELHNLGSFTLSTLKDQKAPTWGEGSLIVYGP